MLDELIDFLCGSVSRSATHVISPGKINEKPRPTRYYSGPGGAGWALTLVELLKKHGWALIRVWALNRDYTVCPIYPKLLPMVGNINDSHAISYSTMINI